jgi:molybdopterin synthase catalytic subunit
MISITSHPIDSAAVTDAVRDHRAGAVVLFLGTVREFTGAEQTSSLTYEAFEEMAVASLGEIAKKAREKWSLVRCAVVHRVGPLELGEVAVAVAVSSAHRGPAFEAGQWVMDHIKKHTPIWKKEFYADGRTEWVHPVGGVSNTEGAGAESDRAAKGSTK